MRLLFDQNLSAKLCELLANEFPESAQVRGLGLERASDREIWDYAAAHGFAIVTQDADFANLAAHLGGPQKVIWLRCGNQPTRNIERLLRHHADAIAALWDDRDKSILEVLATELDAE